MRVKCPTPIDGVHAVTEAWFYEVAAPSHPVKVSRPSGSRPRAGDHPRAPVPAGRRYPAVGTGRAGGRRVAVAVAVARCSARRGTARRGSPAPINTGLQRQPTDDDVVMTTGSRLRGDRSRGDSSVTLWGFICLGRC